MVDTETRSERLGVSVIICCHNSAERLPVTLEHLRLQLVQREISWEVLVIDNASTDETEQIAQRCWPDAFPAPLRVVYESRLGQANARQAGFWEARYEILSFVDDDNWVPCDWIKRVSDLMSEHPKLGALAPAVYPVFETAPPSWFDRFERFYAVNAQEVDQQVGTPFPYLCGAGLSVRKEAWKQLVNDGFRLNALGRKGTALGGADDLELTAAVRLAGWELCIDPALRLEHFMPARRLDWSYLRKLVRASAASTVVIDAYQFVDQYNSITLKNLVQRMWWWHALGVSRHLVPKLPKLVLSKFRRTEGDSDIIAIDALVGRVAGLLRLRGRYALLREQVGGAPWRKAGERLASSKSGAATARET